MLLQNLSYMQGILKYTSTFGYIGEFHANKVTEKPCKVGEKGKLVLCWHCGEKHP